MDDELDDIIDFLNKDQNTYYKPPVISQAPAQILPQSQVMSALTISNNSDHIYKSQ